MSFPPRLAPCCGLIVPYEATCACEREAIRARNRRHDARRPNSRQRGYSKRWEKARAEFLRHHPFCRFCGVEAAVVDHKTPHKGNEALFWNPGNWQALCQPCHDRDKQRMERRGRADA